MTDSIFNELYMDASERAATAQGELAGMAFIAQEFLRYAQTDRLHTVRGKNIMSVMEKTLIEYYQGKGKSSPFADTFEAGIERGMKESV